MGAKSIVLILVAIFIVAGSFALAEYRNSRVKKMVYSATISSPGETVSNEIQNEDSDTDGLKDWEEVLLGTDPHNPDTDKDGTSDGKEVSLNRNPLVRGPNDKAEDPVSATSTNKENLTETDKLARDFFARYMELRQMGVSTDKQSQEEMIGTVLKNGLVLATPKTYAIKDILVNSDDSTESERQYGNQIGSIFIKYNPTSSRNEVVIAKDSLEKEDGEILKEIDPIISSYKNIISALLKVRAPQSGSSAHLNLVNSISMLNFSAESLRKIDKDSVSAVQGATLYLTAAKNLNTAFNEVKNYFSYHNISFSPSEGGSFFIPEPQS